jgi:hypothetical protein
MKNWKNILNVGVKTCYTIEDTIVFRRRRTTSRHIYCHENVATNSRACHIPAVASELSVWLVIATVLATWLSWLSCLLVLVLLMLISILNSDSTGYDEQLKAFYRANGSPESAAPYHARPFAMSLLFASLLTTWPLYYINLYAAPRPCVSQFFFYFILKSKPRSTVASLLSWIVTDKVSGMGWLVIQRFVIDKRSPFAALIVQNTGKI